MTTETFIARVFSRCADKNCEPSVTVSLPTRKREYTVEAPVGEVWGPVGDPVPKSEYPEAWLVWEDELLAPILADDPDRIEYTSYELVADSTEL